MSKNGRLYRLDHSTYRCEYHLVWITKYRNSTMADNYIKQCLRTIIKSICQWKHWPLYAWHIGNEHIHLYLSIPPKYSVSYVMTVLKSKSSAWVKKKTKKIPVGSFWARGYFVSTIGINEAVISQYIKHQREHHQENQRELPLKPVGGD